MQKVLLVVLAALVLSVPAYAQETGLMDKNEVQLAAAWADVADVSATLLAAHYGRFITPNIQAQLGVIWADIDFEGSNVSAFAIAPAIAYYFIGENTTNIVPYLGVGYYFLNADAAEEGSINENGLEAFGGVKFFVGGDYLTSNRAFFVEYRYLNDVFGDNVSAVMVGITNFF